MTRKFYEQDIKDLILEKKHLFIKNSELRSTVLFEKGITVNSVIADCIVFVEDGTIIGVEVKTAQDTTRRLNKQLNSYRQICDYTYVMCDDKHVDKVDKILKDNNHHDVGIVSYDEFRGEAILGKYKEATRSVKKNMVTTYMSLFWKEELLNILGSFKRQFSTLDERGYKVLSADSRGAVGIHSAYVQSMASKRLKKNQLAQLIIDRLGEHKASNLLCNIYINKKLHVEKALKFYHFKGD